MSAEQKTWRRIVAVERSECQVLVQDALRSDLRENWKHWPVLQQRRNGAKLFSRPRGVSIASIPSHRLPINGARL